MIIKTNSELYQSDLYSGECLEHYGVRGMKWGRRKAPPPRVRLVNKEQADAIRRINERKANNNVRTARDLGRMPREELKKMIADAQIAAPARPQHSEYRPAESGRHPRKLTKEQRRNLKSYAKMMRYARRHRGERMKDQIFR